MKTWITLLVAAACLSVSTADVCAKTYNDINVMKTPVFTASTQFNSPKIETICNTAEMRLRAVDSNYANDTARFGAGTVNCADYFAYRLNGGTVLKTAANERGMPVVGRSDRANRIGIATPVILPTTQRLYKARSLTHTVAGGETLYSIARQNCTSVASLNAVNGLQDARSIQIGTRLRLPSQGCR